MKPLALTLALLATVSVSAQTAPTPAADPATTPVAPPKINPAIRNPFRPTAAEIRDIRKQSVERAPASQVAENAPPADAEVLELPKMTVKQQPRPRPRLGDHKILGPTAFN